MNSNKTYSFEDALDIAIMLDEGPTQIDQPDQFPDEFEQDDKIELYKQKSDGSYKKLNNAELSSIISRLQEEMMQMMKELNMLVQTRPDEVDSVELDYDILNTNNKFVQVNFIGDYNGFIVEKELFLPMTDWDHKHDEIILWAKALILREYLRMKGDM